MIYKLFPTIEKHPFYWALLAQALILRRGGFGAAEMAAPPVNGIATVVVVVAFGRASSSSNFPK